MPKVKSESNIGRAKRRNKRKRQKKNQQKSMQELVNKFQDDKYTMMQQWTKDTSNMMLNFDKTCFVIDSDTNVTVINNNNNNKEKEESVKEVKEEKEKLLPVEIEVKTSSEIDFKETKCASEAAELEDKTLTPTIVDVNEDVDTVVTPNQDDSVIILESKIPKRKLSKIDWNHSKKPKYVKDLITNKYVNINPFAPTCSTPKSLKDCNASRSTMFNDESFITIDLTGPSDSKDLSVIDLESDDCSFVSATDLSMSDDSEVTVLNNLRKKNKSKRNLNAAINTLNVSQKNKLLNIIAMNLFSGCQLPQDLVQPIVKRALPTADDTYIKEVVLSRSRSRNSIGSNIYNPLKEKRTGLRIVIIDGSNVAMEHSQGRYFSVQGLKICIDFFVKRGHVVKAFVPRFRQKSGKCSDPVLLTELERRGLVVYTPSREIQGKQIVPYDDRYIVQSAAELDGVIVSGDNYRDLMAENPRWQFVIENRLLQFTWVNNMIMFPRDPLGRKGPTLEQFLKHNN